MTSYGSGQVFLELLARDASAAEFEEPVAAARARDAGAEAVAELERAKLLALRIREKLEKRRRREAELSALYETVGGLAALHDVDAVLQAIVRGARRLLDADTAYLAMYDPARDDAYMRVTDGSVSAKFQQLRLPLGAGLGGLVVQTAAPYHTSRYLGDQQFRHTGGIDDAVADEGLVAILGVPLKLRGGVIGVLYAADRSERPFAREEVSLLSSLAVHAAVALDNARLLQETRAALDDLNAANRLVQAHSDAVERTAAAYEQFTDLVIRGGGVDDIAAAVASVLDGTLAVLDGDARPLARTAETDGDGDPAERDRLRAAVASSLAGGCAVTCAPYTVAAVAAGDEPLGALVFGGRELNATDRLILERAASVTALLLLFRNSVAQAEERVRGDLLTDLLTARYGDPAALRERARRLGTDLDEPHVVVDVACDTVPVQRLTAAAAAWARDRHGLAARHDGRTLLLVPGEDASAAARTAAAGLQAALAQAVTAGGGGPVRGTRISAAHTEAVQCLDALQALGRTGAAAGMRDLGFLGLVLGDSNDVPGFVARALGPLTRYDDRRGTRLLDTVDAYFRHGQNLTRTREALHLHINTVSQRLDRVTQLLGPDWREPQQALEIQLALRLRHVLAAPPR
ncbi:helix-turn-helix domain-containing protein [Streptomyces phytophilus]|uniref:helix-turn-helix domain-containing protein n=1 Tax=Streptomyces phytophilus TaxID=722715 RepID=UPI0015F07486|nr:helix-turn-helix domain-containing protein [Streptomyces phytophilus]